LLVDVFREEGFHNGKEEVGELALIILQLEDSKVRQARSFIAAVITIEPVCGRCSARRGASAPGTVITSGTMILGNSRPLG
ncbi:MAG: hypothetical protein M3283_01365, partial [Actinomycetota bacterium]|nr:hypothetical protein [Actinomycetota bacterium]